MCGRLKFDSWTTAGEPENFGGDGTMKRDARIGMAVVLVLGLSVTALIGRALYKRGGGTGEMEGEVADTSTNSNSEKPADAL